MLWNNRAVLCNAVAVVTRLSTASSFSPMALTTTRTFAQTTSLYSAPPKRYLLNYEYIPDVLEKRGPYREGHLGLAKEMAAEGTCVSGGPFNPPGSDIPNGALFVFTTKEAAEKFAAEDPYIEGGIVTKSTISEWTVAIGRDEMSSLGRKLRAATRRIPTASPSSSDALPGKISMGIFLMYAYSEICSNIVAGRTSRARIISDGNLPSFWRALVH
eukprot:scaffold17210_cov139-Skeletonema_marinoi.AAC.1